MLKRMHSCCNFSACLLQCKHSHTAVRFLVKALVVVHAQGHLAHFTAETALVPILGKDKKTLTENV